MSGIAGIIRFQGHPPSATAVQRMTAVMRHRGPDGIANACGLGYALGHCRLHIAPEAAFERQPLASDNGRLIIVFDGSLSNAGELKSELRSAGAQLKTGSDAELILRAYEVWGASGFLKLDGHFAVVLVDLVRREAIAVRDPLGMRPLYFHHAPALGFCFASEPAALLAIEDLPRHLNEARIADLIAGGLEGHDAESTFYQSIRRLPAAHWARVTADSRLIVERYWQLRTPRTLRLKSDEDYRQTFRSVLEESVSRAMRGGENVGTMLSGGLDSGSVTAIASGLRRRSGGPPLKTVSAIGPRPEECEETRCALASAALDRIEPHAVDFSRVARERHELVTGALAPDDPFDRHMSLVRSVYSEASRIGLKVVLDGGGADVVLSTADDLVHHLRRGRLLRAWHEAAGDKQFWGATEPAARHLLRALRRVWSRPTTGSERRDASAESLINPAFARRISLSDRYAEMRRGFEPFRDPASPAHRAEMILHPRIVAGRERYERAAALHGIEPRDPFFDPVVIAFCLSLPVDQLKRDGWPKYILRTTMQSELDPRVVWRRGRQHLGLAFTQAFVKAARDWSIPLSGQSLDRLRPFIDVPRFKALEAKALSGKPLSPPQFEQWLTARQLAGWLSTIQWTEPTPDLLQDTRHAYACSK